MSTMIEESARDARERNNNRTPPDPLAQLRAEALLVCGYDPHHKGEIKLEQFDEGREDRLHSHLIEATLGRCLLRYLNKRARAN